MHTVLRSATREVVIGPDQPFCIIGERINPTGRPKFQERLRAGDLSQVQDDVRTQLAGGAMVLDVNMGVPLADEAELLARAIRIVQGITDLPICIDSSVVEALEAGLEAYQGKALVNSVTGEQERLDAVLPLVKRYGAAVIALPNEEDEIPEDPRKRLEITKKIVDVATSKYDIPPEDIVIDPLAMPIGANHEYGKWTMEAMSLIRDELGLNMTCGASNVSFGMPGRNALNATFLPMAMTAGLTSAIMDARTAQIVEAVKAADLFLGNDEWGANWIGLHRAKQAAAKAAAEAQPA
jgi:5-methyltetrahydrofolate--homocysteine methyltransferase